MKIISTTSLNLPEVKVCRFQRYKDHRGYFTETFRESGFRTLEFLNGFNFPQHNESFSHANVMRGLHFQWGPPMGKLVRTVFGRMVDMAVDIRKSSPNFGKIILYDMPSKPENDFGEWIWVPPGFAHGNFFTENTVIQYFCTEEYKPDSEAGLSLLAEDLDWSLCDAALRELFEGVKLQAVISEKDKGNFNLKAWSQDQRSQNFQ